MQRRINRSQQGDLGEASAIEWFTRAGAIISKPLGYSPDYDLIIDLYRGPLRVQAKASTQISITANGHERFPVMLATNGGNQSWSGQCKRFDPERFDLLFALTRRGRRWLVPSHAIESGNVITLGGPKYAEFEIEATGEIETSVYGEDDPLLDSSVAAEEYPSGQRMATVNRPAQPSQVRILPPPFDTARPSYQRRLGRSGQAIVYPKRRLTLPLNPFDEAGFEIGDRVRARCAAPGRIEIERINENGPPGGGPFQRSLDEEAA